MWKFRKNNLIINSYDNFFVHKVHLERILHAKPHIQNKGLEIPYFMKKKLSTKELLRSKNRKRWHENGIIYSRLLEIDNSISNYSRKNKPIYCAAFDKKRYIFDKSEKMKNINKENKHFFTRLVKIKSHYPTQRFIDSNYYENRNKRNIKIKRFDNPNIIFATFHQFKNNLTKKCAQLKKSHSVENIEYNCGNNRRYNYETEIISRNYNLDYGCSTIKSYKGINSLNNNIGSLSTMNSIRLGKNLRKCQSAFMSKKRSYNNY